MRFAVVTHRATETNLGLVQGRSPGLHSTLLRPRDALRALGPGDIALGRLDVNQDLDGVEPGLWTLSSLAAAGVTVLNQPGALLSAHDKLVTAGVLQNAGLPHPRTTAVDAADTALALDFPLVLKPRFGSWGRDVVLCRDRDELEAQLDAFRFRPWFRAHGALLQELVPPRGYDLRVVVAGGEMIGAVARIPAAGQWRTNVALGARRQPLATPPEARELAVRAAGASGLDLVGVDLMPLGDGYTILELNGAVDFTREYAPAPDTDVFRSAIDALVRAASPRNVAALP